MFKGGLAGRIGRMAGDSGPERVLVAASFVNRVGNGLFNAASALYFTLVVGLPAVQVGAALTIAGVIGLCAGIPGGHLADRRGARVIMMLALAVQAVSMAALVLVESWAALTITATVDQIAAAVGGAAWGALVARVGGERPARFRAKLRTFVNLGVVLGTMGAGLALAADTRGAYVTLILGNAASFALCAVLLLLLPRYPVLAAPPQQRRWLVFADRPFLTFTALYGAMGLQYPVVSLLLPIWISEHTETPRWTVAALFAVNSAFCVLMQTRIGSRIETPYDGGRAFRTAGLLFLVSCPMMALAAYAPVWAAAGLVLAAIFVHSLGEVWESSACFALGFGLAPGHAQGQYQGVLGLGFNAGQALAPAILTTVVLGLGTAGWLLLALFFATLGAAGPSLARWGMRTRPQAGVAAEVTG
ncbi:MFS transporter [Streptomyces sp. TLI_105]|uniref:MFS transporter n=1 Tax=Streptomyces sp. TLI_105 TaxID=1881019 RepID=UPI00089822ED|nr:MFS transporter [Streptomyces sp. TLI_105]SEB56921.1 Major Facilitator Superfamily protein [Streptomyces sp. TLI_105]